MPDPTEPNNLDIQPRQQQAKRFSPKVIALIVGATLILAGAAYGGYWWREKQHAQAPVDDTADWQTYRNDEYGFEFRYPVKWDLQRTDAGSGPLSLLLVNRPVADAANDVDLNNSISVSSHLNDQHVSLEEWVKQYFSDPPNVRTETTEVAGNRTIKKYFNNFTFDGVPAVRVFVAHDNRVYYFAAQSSSSIATLEKILLTLRFFAPSPPSADIYRDVEFGFELMIPKGMDAKKTSDEANRLVLFQGAGQDIFEVRLRRSTSSLADYSYLDFPIDSQTTLAGQKAIVFKAPLGYCDGPGCGKPFIAYVVKRANDFYHLIFYGDADLSEAEQGVLSTFKLTK